MVKINKSKGQTIVEYIILVALIAFIAFIAMKQLGCNLGWKYGETAYTVYTLNTTPG